MQSEQAFLVTISDEGVACRRPDGKVESVTWDNLQGVLIETNDQGPFASDVFWILVGKRGGCVIPQGATGEDGLLSRLHAVDGFDNNALIHAMSSTENRRFVCWRRSASR